MIYNHFFFLSSLFIIQVIQVKLYTFQNYLRWGRRVMPKNNHRKFHSSKVIHPNEYQKVLKEKRFGNLSPFFFFSQKTMY